MLVTKPFLLGFIFIILGGLVYGQVNNQKIYTRQLSFTCDNDFFLLSGSDRYYTNGLFFDYSSLDKSSRSYKQVNKIELGQRIFNAYKRKITPEYVNEIDRPIAGYLYLSFSKMTFLKEREYLKFAVTPGIVGPAALGEQVQSGWHNIIGVKSKWDWVWKYQLKNEPGINLEAEYGKGFNRREDDLWQISSITNLTLGTILTTAKESVMIQLGRFNAMDHSEKWNSKIGENVRKKGNNTECYLYYSPSIMYQFYNATVQGGLFRKEKGPIVGTLNNILISNELGAVYSCKRYGAVIKLVYLGKEAKEQMDTHIYGSIGMSYRF